MKVAENIRCKDFSLKWVWNRRNIRGLENYGYYQIWYQNKKMIGTADTKQEARKFISKKVKEVNQILEEARKKYSQQ